MKQKVLAIYWDSDAFLGWLGKEADKQKACGTVLGAAERGEVVLVTSSLTLTEVIRIKHQPAIPRDGAEKVRKFFLSRYIVIKQLDRFTAEDARDLVWTHGLKPKDAIHVATARRFQIPVLHSYDSDLTDLNGKIPGIVICKPCLPQGDMFAEQQP